MSPAFLAWVRGAARRHSAQGNRGDPPRRDVARLAPSSGWSREGSRRGSSDRLDLTDNSTTGEGRSPGSRCASPRQGSGEWREPGISPYDPETPRGAGPHSEAGASRAVLPAGRQGLSGGPPRPCLRPRQTTRRCRGSRDASERSSDRAIPRPGQTWQPTATPCCGGRRTTAPLGRG